MAAIQRSARRLLQAGLRNEAPAWLLAMDAVPPVAAKPRHVAKLDTRGQLPFEQLPEDKQMHYKTEVTAMFERGARTSRPSKKLRAPKLVFPEDVIRARFYRQHPLELTRPRDFTAPVRVDWTTLLESGKPLTAEHVVQYTLYLIAQGHTYSEAYKVACHEFYAARIREEQAEEAKRTEELRLRRKEQSESDIPAMGGVADEINWEELKLQKPLNYQYWLKEEAILKNNEEINQQKQLVRDAAQSSFE
ncbi:mitochondrial ribosomal small subunit component [Sorochytrium milnesiophthora]